MKGKTKAPEPAELSRLYEELRIHQVELERQNQELREARQRIEESRDRYAELYDFAPVGFVDLDGRGAIRNVNLTGAAMLRNAHGRLLGAPFARYVAPGDRGKFLGHLKKSLEAKGRATAEVELLPKGGPAFPAQLQSVASRGPERGTVDCRMAITDLSDRKLAEQSLRESEVRFRSLVKDSLVGFFIVQDGRIVFLNSEQEKIFGSLPESLRVEEFTSVHREDLDTFLALCGRDAAAGSGRTPAELRIILSGPRRGEKEVRWAHCRASRISWQGREARLVNMLDVTRTRELERTALVQEKMAALGHVAAGIAHEIRNPLSGVNIYLSTLEESLGRLSGLEPDDRERVDECLRYMKTASAKIASVVQRVMGFTKSIAPSLELANVNEAIEDAVALAQVTLRTHGVKLKKSLPRGLPKCRVDQSLVAQVVLNLITNADQAMDGMQRGRCIEIRSYRDEDDVVIKVSDAGPGVPPRLREKIFDPYFTTKREGTGIGLSFCHRVVTGLGGTISVGEGPLGGAGFRIRLPVPPPVDRT